ncbi:MAG: hypothetical protein HGA47_11625 [Zoogloea sp.]|nr:hypothetical protein [Zoogloea sp.]
MAEAAGFTQAEVEQSFGLKPARAPRRGQQFDEAPHGTARAPSARSGGRQRPPSPTLTLLRLVLLHPAWAARLPIDLLPAETEEGAALIAMVDALSVGDLPTSGVGALLEHYRDTPHAATLARAASQLDETGFEETSVESMYHDMLVKLQIDATSARIGALTEKDKAEGLSPDERRDLARLLLQKTKLRSGAKVSDF